MRPALLLVLVLAVSSPLSAQNAARSPLVDSAGAAWTAGRYPDALRMLLRALRSPDGDRLVDTVALLTGEGYRTFDVAADGRNPRWSDDGTLLSYEAGAGAAVRTHVVRYASGEAKEVAVLGGTGAAFDAAGRTVAYLAPGRSAATTALRRELDSLLAAPRTDAGTRRTFELRRLLPAAESEAAAIRVRALGADEEQVLESSIGKLALQWHGGRLHVAAPDGTIYRMDGSNLVRVAATGISFATLAPLPGGRMLYTVAGGRFGIVSLDGTRGPEWTGTSPAVSRDGRRVVYLSRAGDSLAVVVAATDSAGPGRVVARGAAGRIAAPALSPSGAVVAYQRMPADDWELFITRDGGEQRVTREIQDDLAPVFLSERRLLGLMGERRHRRSYLYDLDTGRRIRLFHNNTVRTVAPEYDWVPSPDGTRLAIVADRDGDTVSPERGLYLTDLERPVTRARVLDRLEASIAAEDELRNRGAASFLPIAPAVREAVARISTERISGYAADVFAFGSKFITQPGNALAIAYYADRLREFGYTPELQWFEPRPGVRTANVIATLTGSADPALEYVVSSHFDSVEGGPGADDNSSGATALLEVARVMAGRPERATIRFAFFTGEEAGLLGSREFVRRAVAANQRIVGALNNDMVGFRNDERMDNTIRYSNEGIRDIQHAAAIQFTDLITYDSKYYQNTDAHAYYEQYGDIVGGIGSYPILGNPHYHDPHDRLDTIDQQLVAEVARTTLATIMRLAGAPSRLAPPVATRNGIALRVDWKAGAESGLRGYAVVWEPVGGPQERRQVDGTTVTFPRATGPGRVGVKALSGNGLEGWDWAWTTVEP